MIIEETRLWNEGEANEILLIRVSGYGTLEDLIILREELSVEHEVEIDEILICCEEAFNKILNAESIT